MGIEHSCHACGCALGRIQAPPDPIYGLRVVVCPQCRAACVRRRPEAVAGALAVRRCVGGAYRLLWRAAGWALLVLGALAMSDVLADSPRGVRVGELFMHYAGLEQAPDLIETWRLENGPTCLLVWAGTFVLFGAMLGAGPAHVGAGVRWATLIGALVLVLAARIALRAQHDFSTHRGSAGPSIFFIAQRARARPSAEFVLAGLALMPLGWPIGRALRRSADRRAAWWWMRRLARARKRRLAA